MKQILIFTLLLISRSAFADQCQVVDRYQASLAMRDLRPGEVIYRFCEPCGDRYPEPVRIHESWTTSWSDWNPRYGRTDTLVYVNGRNIDLAYTFVRDRGNAYRNLANKVGCPALDVSNYIYPEETPSECEEPYNPYAPSSPYTPRY